MFGAIIFIPLYLQLVYGLSATESGLRMLPLMGGLLVAAIGSGRVISRIGRYRIFPHRGHRDDRRRHVPPVPARRRHRTLARRPLHARDRDRDRARDAGARAGRPERRAPREHRRRNLDRNVLPLGRRRLRRGDFGAIFAARLSQELSDLPGDVIAHVGSGVQLSPAEVNKLPPLIHEEFLSAFANALHGVFLWGVAIAIIPFVLSWFLKEVPLRTTLAPRTSELAAEEAVAGGTPPEESLEPAPART